MIANTVIVHYHSHSGRYFNKSVWKWRDGQIGEEVAFSRFDSFGAVAKIDFPLPYFLPYAYVIVKDKYWEHQTIDFCINRNSGIPKTEVWIVDGDETLYYSRQAAVASHAYRYRKPHAFQMATDSVAFDKRWGFDGWLGAKYSEEFTAFRLWAPTAERVELVFYESTDENASVSRVFPMARGNERHPDNHRKNSCGVWFETLHEDLDYQAYCYRVYYRKRTFSDTRDPYATATTANGRRSIIINPKHLKPNNFEVKQGFEATWRPDNPNQVIVYEMHVRDFSMSETSGVSQDKRGKFLGLIESETKNTSGDKTGFDYVKDLGITHIQLQPIFDHHQTIDDQGNYAYNWGYDPENFNVPEASFSSNPHEPATRILELKQVIQAYHDAGIAVIMDVVYNHTYSSQNSALQLSVPDYYYRMNGDGSFQDGSGCGNETASEKEMYRKYMIDSILYWVKEYNIDGFRFDLMGLHDVTTMNVIREELDKIDPRILTFGEGWDMGQGLAAQDKAKKSNASKMPNIGFFNDDSRNAVKGAEVYGTFEKGFVSGVGKESLVAKAILGSDEFVDYLMPSQVVNYVEAHDNYNLNDLLLELHPDDSFEKHRKRIELATAMNLLMQGMSFIQLGQEFARSKLFPTGDSGEFTWSDKQRAMNSYNAPDTVNQVNWNNVTIFKDSINFIKEVIALKRESSLFSYPSYDAIRNHVYIDEAQNESGFIRFSVTDKKKYEIIFSIYGNRLHKNKTNGIILVNNKSCLDGDEIHLEPLTAMIIDVTE